MQVNRFLLTFAVMAATIMQVLDTTITNVALPHMAGELGATSDSISWVLTAYVAAASIFMPLTGYLTDRLGRRRYLLISIAGFVVASGLCGLASGLYEMVGQRQHGPVVLDGHFAPVAAQRVFAPVEALRAFEIGQHVGIAPAGAAHLCPAVVVARIAAHIQHAVDR